MWRGSATTSITEVLHSGQRLWLNPVAVTTAWEGAVKLGRVVGGGHEVGATYPPTVQYSTAPAPSLPANAGLLSRAAKPNSPLLPFHPTPSLSDSPPAFSSIVTLRLGQSPPHRRQISVFCGPLKFHRRPSTHLPRGTPVYFTARDSFLSCHPFSAMAISIEELDQLVRSFYEGRGDQVYYLLLAMRIIIMADSSFSPPAKSCPGCLEPGMFLSLYRPHSLAKGPGLTDHDSSRKIPMHG